MSGIALITGKVQRYRDRQRYGAYLAKRDALKQRHQQERTGLARRHEIQAADLRCRLRALDQIEQREYQTLETAALKARRQRINARHGHMPPMAPVLSLRAGTDGLAAERHLDFSLSRELARAAAEEKLDDKLRLAQAFGPVSGSDEGEQEGGGDSGGLRPDSDGQRRMRQRGRRRLAADFARMVDDPQGEGEGENEHPCRRSSPNEMMMCFFGSSSGNR